MLTERIYFSEDTSVYMDTLCLDNYDYLPKRKAMIVFPGGGYGMLAPHEAWPVARAYFGRGFNTFVLNYSIKANKSSLMGDDGVPLPIKDAAQAIAHVRKNADKYGIDPDKICILGFSAGGHLASATATLWHKDEVVKAAGVAYGENKPNAAVLCYPVITGDEEKGAHLGSFKNLLYGEETTKEQREKFSSEKNVSENTCPCYIWHTSEDHGVPITNSLEMARALKKHGIDHQLHIYPYCNHGIGAAYAKLYTDGVPAKEDFYNRRWLDESIDFLEYILDKGGKNI